MKKIFVTALFAAAGLCAFSADIDHGLTTVCGASSTITLTATTSGSSYAWTKNGTAMSETTQSITVTPNDGDEYICTVTSDGSTTTTNLISEGSFEFAPSDVSNHRYAVNDLGIGINYEYLNFDESGVDIGIGCETTATNANNVKTQYFESIQAQDGTYMLVCDGGNSSDARIWQARNIVNAANPLKKDVKYEFSCYVANIDKEYAKHGTKSLAKLKFMIESAQGTETLLEFTAPEELGKWQKQVYSDFKPTKDLTWANIWIVNFTTADEGNDFAIDNIYFGVEQTSTTTTTESFSVAVQETPTVSLAASTQSPCAGETVTITATVSGDYTGLTWQKNGTTVTEYAGLSTITVNSSTTAGTVDTYTVTAAGDECPSATASVTITSTDCSTPEELSHTVSGCIGFNLTLQPTYSGYATYTWQDGVSGETRIVTAPEGSATYVCSVYDATGKNVSIETFNVSGYNCTYTETACAGERKTLNSDDTTDYISISWTSTDDPQLTQLVSGTDTATPIYVAPTTPGTYTYTLTATYADVANTLTYNGDFEQGNTGFSTDYTYSESVATEGAYYVGTYVPEEGIECNSDHTTGSGNFFAADGDATPDRLVWGQTIDGIETNTTYAFQAYIMCFDPDCENLAELQFKVNDEAVTTYGKTPTGVACEWSLVYALWDSGDNTSVNWEVVNNQSNTPGNDFGVDDISFSKLLTITKIIEITVTECEPETATYNISLCAGMTSAMQSQYSGYATYVWKDESGTEVGTNSETYDATAASGTHVYTCQVYNADGMYIALETFNLTGEDCPLEIVMSGVNNTVCEPDETTSCNGTATATISGGVAPYTYLWSNNETSASISNLCNGTYTVVVTDNVSTTITGSVTIITEGTVNVDEGEVTLCPGESYEFHGQSFTEAGTLTVTVEQEDACTYVYTKVLSFYEVSDEYVSATICEGEAYTFYGETFTESGTYSVVHTDDNGCTMTSYLSLDVTSFANTIIAGDAEICYGDESTITISGAPDGTSYLWTGNGVDGQTSTSVVVSPLSSSTYSVSLTNGECTYALNFEVIVNMLPTLTVETLVGTGETEIKVAAQGGTSPYSYLLDNTYSSTDGIYTGVSKGYHTIHVSDAKNCEADTIAFIEINLIPDKFFSPNGDGTNDLWEIQNIDLIPAKVFIYDRFGRLLAKYDENFAGWDGNYNGHQMPSTDYWYVIQEKATGKKMSGHFTLHRGKTN